MLFGHFGVVDLLQFPAKLSERIRVLLVFGAGYNDFAAAKNAEILVELVCLTASHARAPGQWVEGALPFCLRSDTGATIYAELHIRVIASEARRTLNVRNGRFANHIAILQYQD